MNTVKFNELEQGDEFRFPYESESTVRYVSQIGRIEMYCPRKNDNTMGHSKEGGEEVYLKSDKPVILISKANKQ